MGMIYEIRNLINDKIYIGSTKNFLERKERHIYDLNRNKHHSIILQNSWFKNGPDNFAFKIIEEVENLFLLEREQFYLDTLKPEYNICKIAGSPLGIKHSKQARENMSKAHIGKKLSKESIRKRTLKQSGKNHWTFGKERDKKTRDKISKTLKTHFSDKENHWTFGKERDKKTRDKISKTLSKAINQYDLNLNFIREWNSAKEIYETLKIYHVGDCCNGKCKSAGGYIWKFKLLI